MCGLQQSLASIYKEYNMLVRLAGISLGLLLLMAVLGIDVGGLFRQLSIEILQLVLIGYLGLRLVRAVERIAEASE